MNVHYARLLSTIGIALSLACGCASPAARVGTPLPGIVIVPFTIEPQPLSAALSSQDVFATLLANEAASSAGKALVREGLTATVEMAPSGSAAEGQRVATGTVRVPTSLPPGLKGLRADAQKGTLATAVVRLLDAKGNTIQEAEATLAWREARWLQGAPNFRRNRPVEQVLTEAVGEVVRRAVERLRR